MSAHIVLDEEAKPRSASVLRMITEHLKKEHGIEHTTIQIEEENCGHENA
jgi:Co/Zn/Cd efflux system component